MKKNRVVEVCTKLSNLYWIVSMVCIAEAGGFIAGQTPVGMLIGNVIMKLLKQAFAEVKNNSLYQ